MAESFIRRVNSFASRKSALLVSTLVLNLVLIVFQNVGVFPLEMGDFAFFILLTFLIVLYRPAWGFLFFVSLAPLEIVNVAPEVAGVALRPYQLAGALTAAALALRILLKSVTFRFIRLTWTDALVAAIVTGGFLSAFAAPESGPALKQAVIIFSFGILYMLCRQFLRNVADAKAIIPFVLGPGAIVGVYAVWQNIRFVLGEESFAVMPGRANATFAEPDWLGMYLVVMVSLVYALLFSSHAKASGFIEEARELRDRKILLENSKRFFLYGLLLLFFTALILTVARSAWLGTIAASLVFAAAVASRGSYNIFEWRWRAGLSEGTGIAVTGMIAVGIVLAFHLTTFQLFNRAQSVASGWQKITVSCEDETILPEHVPSVSDVEAYGCRHINLEERESEKARGRSVQEVYRDDPNVNIRKKIYGTVFGLIQEHPFAGVGWGNISAYLGKDDRGAGLNASNVFLEVWLGSGFIGFIAFCALWFGVLWMALRIWCRSETGSDVSAAALFVLLSGIGLTVFNLFNSGILLGFVWVWLAVAAMVLKYSSDEEHL